MEVAIKTTSALRAFNVAACERKFCLRRSLFLPFNGRDQKRVVELPSLDSPQRSGGEVEVLGEFAKYAFLWPDKEKLVF